MSLAQEQQPQRQPEELAPPQQQPVAAPQSDEQVEQWAGSPETAGARESVRRDAATSLSDSQLGALEATVNAPSPSTMIAAAAGGEIGPALIAEVAAQEKDLKREALSRAFEAVVAGGAAAAGDPKAQQAVAKAPPQMQAAAQQVAEDKSAGAPLPDDTLATMQGRFGHDFSDVQVHTGSSDVATLGAGGATQGTHIHFAPGEYQPGTPEGERLIAHELTHVVQQRGAAAAGAPQVAPSDSTAEQQAEQVAGAVAQGETAPAVQPASAAADAVHLGEAGVHHGIELEAAGVGGEVDPKNLTAQQQAALEMYAGNFMRDYSQLAAPTPLSILSHLPAATSTGLTGAAGARTLMDAIVQCIAILELGKEIGKGLVTRENIGVYEAEHHIDNPMGTKGENDFITGTDAPTTAASPDQKECKTIATVDARGDEIMVDNGAVTSDTATQEVHAGSAVPGLQYENPELYQVGDGGLANHISNSTEHAKDRMLDAVRLGPTPPGRMNLGMGQHIVEDYFSHSNFIEVALNRYIGVAMESRKAGRQYAAGQPPEKAAAINQFLDGYIDAEGKPQEGAAVASDVGGVHGQFAFVDSLYDQTTTDGRQAITTGTFGGTDTKVSLGHVLLPKLPIVERALHKGVDVTFGVIDTMSKMGVKPTWEMINGLLEGKGRDGAIAQTMLEASNSAGLAVECPVDFNITTHPVGLPLIGQIPIPDGIAFEYKPISITDAMIQGAAIYTDAMQRLDTLKQYASYVRLDGVIASIENLIKSQMTRLAAAVRAKMTELIRGMIAELANLDPKEIAHQSIPELTEMAEKKLHDLNDRTSMESRMQVGGDLYGLSTDGLEASKAELERRVGPVRPRDPSRPGGTTDNPWVSVNPLPPSHSEISKDHPPHLHEEHPPHSEADATMPADAILEGATDGHSGHDEDAHPESEEEEREELLEGSTFYGLHRALAVEADRHVMHQMETCWGPGAELIPGQNIDERDMAVSHQSMLDEATNVAAGAADAARSSGHRHAQSDARAPDEVRSNPDVRSLLDLVDYFVSHPTASSWWYDIFDAYVAANGPEVAAAIGNRNKTRGHRKPAGGPVQRKSDGTGRGDELNDEEMGEIAALSGPGGGLPHHETIQRSFGDHDVGGIRAHVGGEAADASRSLGAQAFATGNDVGFASAPDLHTAAHEAAHVIQQREGIVALKSTVSETGDVHEQHADRVADAVVAGESAAPILDEVHGKHAGPKEPAKDASARFENDAAVEDVTTGSTVYKSGDKGRAVTKLQAALVDLGYLKPSGVDGDFGPKTEAAVRKFQADVPVAETGEFDQATMVALHAKFDTRAPYVANAVRADRNKGRRSLEDYEKDQALAAMLPTGSAGASFVEDVGGLKYGDRIKAQLGSEISRLHTELYTDKVGERADPAANFHTWGDLEGPASCAKKVTDKLYGDYKKMPALSRRNHRLVDQWTDEEARNSGRSPDWKKAKADEKVRYLIDSNCFDINEEHNANTGGAQERAILDPIVESFIDSPAEVEKILQIEMGWEGASLDGRAYVQRYKKADDDGNRAQLWDLFHTCIHEYMHTLRHDKYDEWAESLGGARAHTLIEGFCDFFTLNVRASVVVDTALQRGVEGSYYDAAQAPPSNADGASAGVYSSHQQAEQVVSITGVHNAQEGYFKGDVKRMGAA